MDFKFTLNMLIFSLVLFKLISTTNQMIAINLTATTTLSSLITTKLSSNNLLISTTTSQESLNEINLIKIACDNHENCSSRILSLDAYCCQSSSSSSSSNYCCNWFEYSTSYKSTKSTLPFRQPSILTILMLLILLVCLLFVSYCFSILFCFCFKCGLFKRPKVVLINSNSLLMQHNSDSTTAELIVTSPKHSTTTSSSSTSSTLTLSNNNNNQRNKQRSKQQQQQKRTTSRQSRQSPTARVYSNHNQNRRHSNRSNRSNQQRENNNNNNNNVYIDYENDSPFLIPAQLASNNNNTSHNRQLPTTSLVASAPLALADEINLTRTNNLLPSLTSSITSSLGFGASLMEVIESTEINRNNHQSSNVTAITNSTNTETVNHLTPAYYLDEKPPSYDVAVGAYQSLEYFNRL